MKSIKLILLAAVSIAVLAVDSQAQQFFFGTFGTGTVRSIDCDTSQVAEGPSGANVTWNIAAVAHDSSQFTVNLVPAANTPYAASFPAATDAFTNGSQFTVYSYFRITSDSLILLGFADSLQTVVYFNPQLLALNSLSFGNSFTDTYGYRDSTTASGITLISKVDGTRTVAFDGTGTLVLPWKTFSNARRIKTTSVQTDSTWLGTVFTSVNQTQITSFSWVDQTLPLNTSFAISQSTIGSILGSITSKSVTYTEPVQVHVIRSFMNGSTGSGAIRVSVSPFDNAVAIRMGSEVKPDRVLFTAYDMSGKTISTANCTTEPTGMSRGSLKTPLTKGVYLYSLKTGNALLANGKIVVR